MQVYTLGPLDEPLVTLMDSSQRAAPPAIGWGAVDEDGCTWAMDYPDGWDTMEFQTPVDKLAGVDGGVQAPQSIGVRTINVQGVVVGPDRAHVRRAIARLRASLPRRGRVTFAVTDDGVPRLYVIAAPTGPFQAHPKDANTALFSFALVSTDPYKRDAVVRQLSTGLPYSEVSSGVDVPFTLGSLVLDPSPLIGGSFRVTNLGDAPTKPKLTITGPMFYPVVRNLTTGDYSQFDLDLPAGAVFEADFYTGITTINGQPRAVSYAGYASRPWSLPPGDSDIQFAHRGLYDPATTLTVSWNDRYL
jgi:hypothetical protein